MSSTIDTRLDKLEGLLTPIQDKPSYVCYFEGKETKEDAVNKWNIEHHTDFPAEEFDEVIFQIIDAKPLP